MLDQNCAPRRPVFRLERGDALFGAALERGAAGGLERRDQHAQGFPHIRLERDLGAVVLGEVPFDKANLQNRQAVGQRIDLAMNRHSQGIGAEHDHQIVGRQDFANLLLRARQRTHEAGAFRQKLRAVGR